MKLPKVTPRQRYVLERMNSGWALGNSGGMNATVWLQKNGLGRGGDTADVHMGTFYGLCEKRLISERVQSRLTLTTLYVLTDLGRAVLQEKQN